ncbi:hypothetical protein AWZ03_002890 [Drosophila navojoa]|uniref:Uncharacterized protein n=1 Tax=Drosophila navojoa TaxID=7232 RepID=A0A484BP12_DRONA|nr:hypothetical protein AWZ03_002890 [Drosophila navojoa]
MHIFCHISGEPELSHCHTPPALPRLPQRNQFTILADEEDDGDEDEDEDDDVVVLTAPAKLGHNKVEETGRRGRSLP